GGMEVAEGRALKARELKEALIEKNYLRGIYAKRVKPIDPIEENVKAYRKAGSPELKDISK
ncbi:MAG: hypothetical protein KKD77_21845, partial [Gammaproteobacteria bacterium]|nr:hypothetical protein [Gammaproteobacteria bacterium]